MAWRRDHRLEGSDGLVALGAANAAITAGVEGGRKVNPLEKLKQTFDKLETE